MIIKVFLLAKKKNRGGLYLSAWAPTALEKIIFLAKKKAGVQKHP